MANFKRRILIDLDGVLNKYGEEKYDENSIPAIREGAVNFLEELCKDADLYLFTSRNLMLASKWLTENKLDKYYKDVTNIKIPAFLHIDDRAVCFKGDFSKTIEDVKNFQVFWHV